MENIITLNLQKGKEAFAPAAEFYIRRGDAHSLRRTFQIMDGGNTVDLSDKTVLFMAYNGAQKVVSEQVQTLSQSGKFEYEIPAAATAFRGRNMLAYFHIQKDSTIATTNAMSITVLNNVDVSDAPQVDYVPIIGQIIEQRDSMVTAANATMTALNETNSTVRADEESRVAAEQSRVNAEALRVAAESDRAGAEAARVSTENARKSAETSRASAETARVNAEKARAAAETSRTTAESARATAETQRAQDQDKNNADQAQNNLMARQGQPQYLASGEYDTATLEPTITSPIAGKIYLVPTGETGDDQYIEWLYRQETSTWEKIGSASKPVTPISTGQIDTVISGSGTAQGEEVLNTTGLQYYTNVLQNNFSQVFSIIDNKATSAGSKATSAQSTADTALADAHNASKITSGTLGSSYLPIVPISKGGTGATTATSALSNLGLTQTATTINALPARVTALEDSISRIINLLYPVGAIIWLTWNKTPNGLGYSGTWIVLDELRIKFKANDQYQLDVQNGTYQDYNNICVYSTASDTRIYLADKTISDRTGQPWEFRPWLRIS